MQLLNITDYPEYSVMDASGVLQFYCYRLVELMPASDSVMRLCLQAEGHQLMPYREGQFLSLRVPDGQWRSYSMASPWDQGGLIELHVRLMPGGHFSSWLENVAQTGDVLEVQGPFGECVWQSPAHPSMPVIMLATGTGIAPVKAVLEKVLPQNFSCPIALYWGGRIISDLYLADFFTDLAKVYPNFRFIPVLAEVEDKAAGRWNGRQGFVQNAVAEDYVTLSDAMVYACGSPLMVDAALALFTEQCALPPEHFFADAFISTFSVPQKEARITPVHIHVTQLDGTTRSLTRKAGGSLMEALAEGGFVQGICGGQAACGTCRVRIADEWEPRMTAAGRAERRLLSTFDDVSTTDRLACQIMLGAELDGLCIRLGA